MPKAWKLQDAKAQFSKVVEDAITKGPQIVTRYGEAAVVIMGVEQYEELVSNRPSFTEFLLSFPKVSDQRLFQRKKDAPRDIKL